MNPKKPVVDLLIIDLSYSGGYNARNFRLGFSGDDAYTFEKVL
jgi:hypothetical protein